MVGEDRPANCKSIRNERKARSLNSGSGEVSRGYSQNMVVPAKRGNRIERKGVAERTVHGKPSLLGVCVCVYLLVTLSRRY